MTKLTQLKQLLKHKKSRQYYAEKLEITVEEVESLMKQLRSDLEIEHNVDTNNFEISAYWSKTKTSSVLVRPKVKELDLQEVIDRFTLKSPYVIEKHFCLNPSVLILPKQDAHFDKYDINGKNDIEQRFNTVFQSYQKIVSEAKSDTLVYVVGSDQFNSEWTSMTTKGTPQQNIMDYEDSFEAILHHEIQTIEYFIQKFSHIQIIYVSGNHDNFVGWHLIKMLQTYFNKSRIEFDTTNKKSRKYTHFGNSVFMFNHGDVVKPEELINIFPIESGSLWNNKKFYYIFTGDKHHTKEIERAGINFIQIPAMSTSKSKWDERMGFQSKAAVTGFKISYNTGMKAKYIETLWQ